jgi:hypothetical protein
MAKEAIDRLLSAGSHAVGRRTAALETRDLTANHPAVTVIMITAMNDALQ